MNDASSRPAQSPEKCTVSHGGGPRTESGPGRIRTCDQGVMSPLFLTACSLVFGLEGGESARTSGMNLVLRCACSKVNVHTGLSKGVSPFDAAAQRSFRCLSEDIPPPASCADILSKSARAAG